MGRRGLAKLHANYKILNNVVTFTTINIVVLFPCVKGVVANYRSLGDKFLLNVKFIGL